MDFIEFRITPTIIFIALTYFQALFFYRLYSTERIFFKSKYVPVFCIIGIVITPILYFYWSLEVLYNIPLIWFYLVQVLSTYGILHTKYKDNKLISLAFLLPYVNSIFWELPLHLSDFVIRGVTNNLILQTVHLLPLTLFLSGIRKHFQTIVTATIWNSLFTLLLFEVRINYIYNNFKEIDIWFGFFNRLISYIILMRCFLKLSNKQRPRKLTSQKSLKQNTFFQLFSLSLQKRFTRFKSYFVRNTN